MRVRKTLSIFFCLVLGCVAFLPAAHADEWNQMTKFTFSGPIEIPHAVLPAGTYWFVLATGPAQRNVVRIFNSDRSRQYATLITLPTIRSQSTDRTEVTFAERPSNKPDALLTWYYPGRLTGHEFQYRPRREKEFVRDPKQDVVGTSLKTRP